MIFIVVINTFICTSILNTEIYILGKEKVRIETKEFGKEIKNPLGISFRKKRIIFEKPQS